MIQTEVDVSVVYVNYLTEDLLRDSLDSLREHCNRIPYEILVVDNRSNQEKLRQLCLDFRDVRLVETADNLGFGRACNLGASRAAGRYLLFLNPDTVIENDVLSAFVDLFEGGGARRRIGVVGGLLRDSRGRVGHSFGFLPSLCSDFVTGFLNLEKLRRLFGGAVFRVGYVMGADLFLPREVFEEVGGFDERFFMYYEETDLQLKLKNAGYDRCISRGPRIKHLESRSFTKRKMKDGIFFSSKHAYYRKNLNTTRYVLSGLSLIVGLVARLAVDLVMGSYSRFRGHLHALQVHWLNLRPRRLAP